MAALTKPVWNSSLSRGAKKTCTRAWVQPTVLHVEVIRSLQEVEAELIEKLSTFGIWDPEKAD